MHGMHLDLRLLVKGSDKENDERGDGKSCRRQRVDFHRRRDWGTVEPAGRYEFRHVQLTTAPLCNRTVERDAERLSQWWDTTDTQRCTPPIRSDG